jgi:anti-sigma factor RsiW
MKNFDYFSKKVSAYLDGTLNESERTELEAYAGTNAEFARFFREKEEEYSKLKKLIPQLMDHSALPSIEAELKEVIQNLFTRPDSSMLERLSAWMKEKL